MGIIRLCGTPIKERGISWVESYSDKSAYLKEQFEDQVGPGSYFRWEGHDKSTDTDYYVVVTPGFSKKHGYHFFAGLRKEPATNGSSGKNFTTQGEALSYAIEHWNVPRPEGMQHRPYVIKDIEDKEIIKENVHASFDTKEDNIRLSGKGKMIILDMTEDVITKEAMAYLDQGQNPEAPLGVVYKITGGRKLGGRELRYKHDAALIVDPKTIRLWNILNTDIYAPKPKQKELYDTVSKKYVSLKDKKVHFISTCIGADQDVFGRTYNDPKNKDEDLFRFNGKDLIITDFPYLQDKKFTNPESPLFGKFQEVFDDYEKKFRIRCRKTREDIAKDKETKTTEKQMDSIRKKEALLKYEETEFNKRKFLKERIEHTSILERNITKINLSLKVKSAQKDTFFSKWDGIKNIKSSLDGSPIFILPLPNEDQFENPKTKEVFYNVTVPIDLYPTAVRILDNCSNIKQPMIIKDQRQRDSARIYDNRVGIIEKMLDSAKTDEEKESILKRIEKERNEILNKKVFQLVKNVKNGENIVFEPITLRPLGINTKINKARGREAQNEEADSNEVPYVFKDSAVAKMREAFPDAEDLKYALVSGAYIVTHDMLLDSRTCSYEYANPYEETMKLNPLGQPLFDPKGEIQYEQQKLTFGYGATLKNHERVRVFNPLTGEEELQAIPKGMIEEEQMQFGARKVIENTISFFISNEIDPKTNRYLLHETNNGEWSCYDGSNVPHKIKFGPATRFSCEAAEDANSFNLNAANTVTYSNAIEGEPKIPVGFKHVEIEKDGKTFWSIRKDENNPETEIELIEILYKKQKNLQTGILENTVPFAHIVLTSREYNVDAFSTNTNISEISERIRGEDGKIITVGTEELPEGSVENLGTKGMGMSLPNMTKFFLEKMPDCDKKIFGLIPDTGKDFLITLRKAKKALWNKYTKLGKKLEDFSPEDLKNFSEIEISHIRRFENKNDEVGKEFLRILDKEFSPSTDIAVKGTVYKVFSATGEEGEEFLSYEDAADAIKTANLKGKNIGARIETIENVPLLKQLRKEQHRFITYFGPMPTEEELHKTPQQIEKEKVKQENPSVIDTSSFAPSSISIEQDIEEGTNTPDLTNEAEAIEYMRAASDTNRDGGDWERREEEVYNANKGYPSWYLDKIYDHSSDELKEGTVYWELLNKEVPTQSTPSMPLSKQDDSTKAPTSISINPSSTVMPFKNITPKKCQGENWEIGVPCNKDLDQNGICRNPKCDMYGVEQNSTLPLETTTVPTPAKTFSNSIETLIKTANKLDEEGKFQEAAAIDRFIKILAAKKDSEE